MIGSRKTKSPKLWQAIFDLIAQRNKFKIYLCQFRRYGLFAFNHSITLHSKKIDDVSILVGTNDLTEGGERYHVEKLIMHNGYNIPRLANNIGLIRVQDIIEFNQFVQPIEYSREEIQSGFILQFSMYYVC